MKSLIAAALVGLSASAPAAPPVPPADTAQVDVLIAGDTWTIPPDLTMRARVAAITPEAPTDIIWRWGGEGLGGSPRKGVFGLMLEVGQWSEHVPVVSLNPGSQFPRVLFLTVTAGDGGKLAPAAPRRGDDRPMVGGSKNVNIEFEFAYKGKPLKKFTVAGPDGGTVGIVIPAGRLAGNKAPDIAPEFLDELGGLVEYAQRRAARLESLPWAKEPLPTKFAIQSDLGGYGAGSYFGIRTTDPAVIEAEVRSLRQLGINGLRNAPSFLLEKIDRRDGYAKELARIRDTGGMGFPVPRADERNPATSDPEAGCPYAAGVAGRTKAGVERVLADIDAQSADEFWSITVDEIGSVYDQAKEGKRHVTTCPQCAEAFRAYVKGKGVQPADLGNASWDDVKPFDSYVKDFNLDPAAGGPDHLRAYHTGMFANHSTAKLFTPLRDAVAAKNDEKRKALAAGDTASPAAKRAWAYTYALRGNTFLMGGHSLDFFDFYRLADNAFCYETSNREARVWHWDSYLCDVGRVVSADQKLAFGVYVKPHRGAPIQRALSAASRGATMLYWYTYGPDWAKGDTFASDAAALDACSKAARLLAKCEDVLYGATWAVPAEVAVVVPRSGELMMRLTGTPPDRAAAWENAKWTFTALAHAHVPVDPLDEQMLVERDLSRYKAVYVSGTNLIRVAADKLAKYVEAGGTLYTSGGGLRFDEANRPLAALQPVLGLKARRPLEMWKKVALYGATSLEHWDEAALNLAPIPADAAKVTGRGALAGEFAAVVGREVLDPADGTEVVATYADGAAAATRRAHGKGVAWVVGVFPGLEYSATLRTDRYDMRRDLDPVRRAFAAAPALAARVKPVVDADHPTVEGVLVRNEKTGRRAVVLMNWTYRVAAQGATAKGQPGKPVVAHVPLENVKVTIRGVGTPARVTWAMTGAQLPAAAAGDGISLTIPRLEEAGVLLLE